MTLSFDQTLHLTAIYRPPPSRQNKFTNSMFVNKIDELLESTLCKTETTFLVGDFNLHCDFSTKSDGQKVCTLFSEHGLIQLVRELTHRRGKKRHDHITPLLTKLH